ncbi:MAG TPA: hypothetical protein VFJ87_03685 [Rhodanobacteraceae bacterium]|nr:hypothetical protein [Rhodanobacteraceae bacterium]
MRSVTLQECGLVAAGTDKQVDDAAGAMAAASGIAAATGLEPVAALLLIGAAGIEIGGAIGDLF